MQIISKFTIGSEEGLSYLFSLRRKHITQEYEGLVEAQQLQRYLLNQVDPKQAILELNDLSTQMLTVFVDEIPAGYALIKQTEEPAILKDRKVIQFERFYIDPAYDTAEVRESLWKKCKSITASYEAIWMEVHSNNPLLSYFEAEGFQIHEQTKMQPFAFESVILIREKDAVKTSV